MKHRVQADFVVIAKKIIAESMSEHEWAKIEASDMFQMGSYCGGYESLESAFIFSYLDPDGLELCFQLTLEELDDVVSGRLRIVDVWHSDS